MRHECYPYYAIKNCGKEKKKMKQFKIVPENISKSYVLKITQDGKEWFTRRTYPVKEDQNNNQFVNANIVIDIEFLVNSGYQLIGGGWLE